MNKDLSFKKKSLYVILFLYGLMIPQVSFLSVTLYGLYKLFFNYTKILKNYSLQIVVLVFFTVSYYGIAGYHEIGPNQINKSLLLFVMVYIIGLSINLNNYKITHILLSLIFGLSLFVFASVYFTYFTENITRALADRDVINIWSGEILNSPIFGAYTLLALSLLPTVFLSILKVKMKLFIMTLILMSIMALVLFQSRGPFISSVIIYMFSFFYLKYIFQINLFQIKSLIFIFLFFTIFIYYAEDGLFFVEAIDAYLELIENKGMDSGRYYAWMMGLQSLFSYPLGGREYDIGGLSHVHNMYLDIHYTSGLLPLSFLFMFMASHLKSFLVLIRKGEVKDKLFLVCFGLGLLLPTFFEPIMEASITFFSFLVFYLALLKNYSLNINRNKGGVNKI